MSGLIIILIFISAFLVIALFWSGVLWIIAQIGGWPKLAEKYPGREPENPKCWYLQSALFRGWSQYRGGVLRVCADSQALHLSTIFPFSVINKPLSIPWHEISGKKKTRWHYYGVELQFQQSPNIPVYITTELADSLIEVTNRTWQYREG